MGLSMRVFSERTGAGQGALAELAEGAEETREKAPVSENPRRLAIEEVGVADWNIAPGGKVSNLEITGRADPG
jgi:hypothetical protein